MAKLFSSVSLLVCLCGALSPAVYADRYQARFELVDRVGLSYGASASTASSPQCSQKFDSRHVSDQCPGVSVLIGEPFQHEATLFIDGEQQRDWNETRLLSSVSNAYSVAEVTLILQ